MEKELYRVLMDIGIHPDCIDAGELTEEIYRHMERGLQGEEGSMMMIPAYLFADGEIRMDEPVAVIDAGGTNLRAAKVVFTENGPEIPARIDVLSIPSSTTSKFQLNDCII